VECTYISRLGTVEEYSLMYAAQLY
jgi:hypothetical protein